MAEFKQIHQKDDQSSRDFEKQVANEIGNGFHVSAGYADPQGEHSWVMLEKGNRAPSGSSKSSSLITE